MESFLLDARYALRRLRLSPGFSLIAALIIGAGIGGNTAIFSIVNAVLLRPQPYERPEELVNIYVSDSDGQTYATASFPEFKAVRETGFFRDVIAFDATIVNRVTPDGARLHFAEAASGNYWSMLGLRPHLGRLFSVEEDVPGAAPVAVVGYRTWMRDFGGDSSLVGSTINLNGLAVSVIGIAPRDYDGVIVGLGTQLWLPSAAMSVVDPAYGSRLDDRGSRSTWIRARLTPGSTVAQAQAAMNTLMTNLARDWGAPNEGRSAQVVASQDVRFHPGVDRVVQPVAFLLLVVVAIVLAIACSNLANLLLASATRRQREVAIRLALGAERGRLVRQFLVESVALGLLGGMVGLVLAALLVRLITTFQPPIAIPIALNVGIDGTVLAYTALLALGTGILFGLAPALRASRPNLVPALKNDTTTIGTRHRRFGLRNVLVVSQVSGSLLLLVVAGLLVRHMVNSQHVDPGFETNRIAMVTMATDLSRMEPERVRGFLDEYRAALASRPGITGVALTDRVPLGAQVRTRDFAVDGYTPPGPEPTVELDVSSVDPGYFDVMRVPLVSGRNFTERDDLSAPRVVIVSEAAARRFWGSVAVIGRVIRHGTTDGAPLEVVGVARDTRVRTLGEAPRAYVYFPLAQMPGDLVTALAASAGDARVALADMRSELERLAPDMPVFEAKTMPEHLQLMLFLPRLGAALLSLFSGLALVLALTGLYGVVAFAVTQRTRELGIRIALGARPSAVTGMVVREGLTLVAVGAVIGLVPAVLASRLLSGVLFNVAAFDGLTFAVTGALFGLVAFAASYIPARRAARVDPLVALRYD